MHVLGLLALALFCLPFSLAISAVERQALEAMRDSLNASVWTGAGSCDWVGISCGFTNETVLAINMIGYGLSGSLPAEIGNLTKLRTLSMWFNEISGPIPPELGKLSELSWLALSMNRLNGTIPPELAGLVSLTYLALHSNQLTGVFPAFFDNITSLQNCSVTGGGNNFICIASTKCGGNNCVTTGTTGTNSTTGTSDTTGTTGTNGTISGTVSGGFTSAGFSSSVRNLLIEQYIFGLSMVVLSLLKSCCFL